MNDTNVKANANELILQSWTKSPSFQEWKMQKHLVKIKEDYNNEKSYSHANYYNLFDYYKSDKGNNNKDNKYLIKVLKEIDQKRNIAILLKEERKKISTIKSKKKICLKIDTMKE